MNKRSQQGFSLIELLVVIAIVGVLSTVVLVSLSAARGSAYFARAQQEFKSMRGALELYYNDNDSYPPDANRGVSPDGLDAYLTSSGWPDGPWPGSAYDWDSYVVGSEQVYQISIRFCTSNDISSCRFPDEEWAEGFGVNSSLYYCVEGPCRAHPSDGSAIGHCVNC